MCDSCMNYCKCICIDARPKCSNRRFPLACPCRRGRGRAILLSQAHALPAGREVAICPEDHEWVKFRDGASLKSTVRFDYNTATRLTTQRRRSDVTTILDEEEEWTAIQTYNRVLAHNREGRLQPAEATHALFQKLMDHNSTLDRWENHQLALLQEAEDN